MSNRRRARDIQQHKLSALDAMTDHKIPGGCDDCCAYQTVTQQSDGLYQMVVHHDSTCPFYRSLR